MQQEKPSKNDARGPSKAAQSVPFQAVLMALGTLASRLLGLVREVLFAALFDRAVTDAWYAAFKLPNVFRRLFGEGALSVSFIPVFVQAEAESRERAQNLANAFYTVFLIFISAVTVLGILFIEPLFNFLMDENFKRDLVKLQMTYQMGQIMFGYIFLVCTYAYLMGILNSLGRFGLPAAAPTLFNVAMIVSTLWPQDQTQWNGQALAWGVIVGGVLQLVVLFPALIELGYLPKPTLNLRNKDVGKVLKAMGPGILGLSLLQVTTLVNLNFSSSLGQGPISYLNLADRLMELPLSLVSVSLGAALLPTLSRLAQQSKKSEMISVLYDGFKLNLFISLAAAVGLFVLAHPIVELLFERGRFSSQETLIVADVVRIYSGILIFTASVRVFVPGFYAINNTWIPAVVSLVALVVHVLLAPVLMQSMGLRGLNISTLVSLCVNWCALVIAFRILIGKFPWGQLMVSSVRWLPALVGLFAVLQLYWWARDLLGSDFIGKLLSLSLVILLGGLVFFLLSLAFKVPEAEKVLARLRRKRA